MGFKIMLPFTFVLVVSGDQYFDVRVGAAVAGSSQLRYGGAAPHVEAVVPAFSYDFSGRSVSNAGDVNGDGYDDLVIGVPYGARCYVMYGNRFGFVNMTGGFTIFGAQSSDLTGWSVSGAGDINNDTFADIIIGAPAANGGGTVYLIYGSELQRKDVHLSHFMPHWQGRVWTGAALQDGFGLSVSSAGDVDGDGFDDLIVGALKAGELFSGAVYVIFGFNSSTAGIIRSVKGMSVSEAITIAGQTHSWFGYSVSGAGDVNGDGFDDLIVGSAPRRVTAGAPVSYLIYGNKRMTVTSVPSMTASQGVVITGGGVVVSGMGDINGDGFDDVMIGTGVDLSLGGGVVVIFPDPIGAPTIQPSAAPSFELSTSPTRPTLQPSISPSAPSSHPTATPSQPTSTPSSQPSTPTLRPSAVPSALSSRVPTKTFKPSVSATPSTVIPSVKQTPYPSIIRPTKYPLVYPTRVPSSSILPTSTPNITYMVIPVRVGGVYVRNVTNTHFIVNTSMSVRVVGTGGCALFTVLAVPQAVLEINFFNVSTDLINLRAFKTINAHHELNVSLSNQSERETRHLTSTHQDVTYQATVTLPNHQRIVVSNITASGLLDGNFIFAPHQAHLPPPINRMKKTWGPVIAASVACGSLVLFLVWKFGQQLKRAHKNMNFKIAGVDWVDVERTNPTYISFRSQDSSCSIKSDGEASEGSSATESSESERTLSVLSELLHDSLYETESEEEHKSAEGEGDLYVLESRRMSIADFSPPAHDDHRCTADSMQPLESNSGFWHSFNKARPTLMTDNHSHHSSSIGNVVLSSEDSSSVRSEDEDNEQSSSGSGSDDDSDEDPDGELHNQDVVQRHSILSGVGMSQLTETNLQRLSSSHALIVNNEADQSVSMASDFTVSEHHLHVSEQSDGYLSDQFTVDSGSAGSDVV